SGSIERMEATPDGSKLLVWVAGARGIRCWHLDRLLPALSELGLDTGFSHTFAARHGDENKSRRVSLAEGPGLVREEYYGADFRLLANRSVDTKIDHDWSLVSPSFFLPQPPYSLRWRGSLQAPSPGKYRVELEVRDGARLW